MSEIQSGVEQHYKEKMNGIFGHLAVPGKQPTDDDLRSLMFGDYMSAKDEERFYNEIEKMDDLREVQFPVFISVSVMFIFYTLL